MSPDLNSIVEVFTPDINSVLPSKRKYLFRAGLKSFPEAHELLGQTVNSMYKIGIKVASPQVIHALFNVQEIEKELIPSNFTRISKISFFASTIGSDIDTQIEEFLKQEKVLEASLLDAWGSESVEALNKWFDTKLRDRYGKGTMRFSPGYDDLDVTKNISLLKLLQMENNEVIQKDIARIHADPRSGILFPKKSTTCLIGWFT